MPQNLRCSQTSRKFTRAERGSRENPDLPSFLAVDLVLFEGVVEGAKNFAVHVF